MLLLALSRRRKVAAAVRLDPSSATMPMVREAPKSTFSVAVLAHERHRFGVRNGCWRLIAGKVGNSVEAVTVPIVTRSL